MADKKRQGQSRPNQSRSNQGRPTSTGASRRPAAPPATGWRAALNRYSAPLLIRMHALPRWLVPTGLALLMLIGFFVGGSWAWVGTLALVVVTAFIGWLFALSWPVLTFGGRVARAIVTSSLVGITYLKATGQL